MRKSHVGITAALTLLAILSILIPVENADAFRNTTSSSSSTVITQTNEYSNYVHFQPEWKSYPKNLIIDVSNTWEREIVPGSVDRPTMEKHGAKERQNMLQFVNNKPVVSVQYDYMDCQTQWFHYAKTGLDFIEEHLESYEETRQIPNTAYSNESQVQKLQSGFAQFIPICTSKESTNYEYTISINDDTIGFDAYFVPSQIQQKNYFSSPSNFEYYSQDGCSVINHQKFSGECSIGKNSGLLVVIPDELTRPMTKISIKITEA